MWKTKGKLKHQSIFFFFVILAPNQTLKVQGRRLIILQFSLSVCCLFIKSGLADCVCTHPGAEVNFFFNDLWDFEETKIHCPFCFDISFCFKEVDFFDNLHRSFISAYISIITPVMCVVFTVLCDQVSPCNQINKCTCLLFWRPSSACHKCYM